MNCELLMIDSDNNLYNEVEFDNFIQSYCSDNQKEIKDIESEEFDLICSIYLNKAK